AEALVESIFRRARYVVAPFHASEVPLRLGREDFSPDFTIRAEDSKKDSRDLLVEVKYRSSIDQFMSVENKRNDRSVFVSARRKWSALCLVFVTDRPQPGRSCFQALAFLEHPLGKPYETVDLAAVEYLGIFPHNIADHELLMRRIFALLTGG